MLTLDVAWIGVNKTMYRTAVESIQRQHPMKVDVVATVLVYIFLYAAIVLVALPPVAKTKPQADDLDISYAKANDTVFSIFKKSVRYGGSLGLLIYGVYNLTTKAILHNYPWKVCILDTTWGTVLFTLVCFFSVLLTKSCQDKNVKMS